MTDMTDDTAKTAQTAPLRLEPGVKAPDFTLPAIGADGEETKITLSRTLEEQGKVLLYFYPAAMTPGCTTQACDFRDNIARLSTLGYTVLGVSKDPLDKLRRFAERDHLTFALLSDVDLTVHRLYAAYGEKNSYGRIVTGVLRSTFAIDRDGTVTLARYNVRAKGHVDSLLKRLS